MNFINILKGYPRYLTWRVLNNVLPYHLQKPNKRFQNIHADDICFILGSGPSIANQDLTRLAGQIVMTQNSFYTHKDIAAINPKYHVIIPKYQAKEYDNDWKEWLGDMDVQLPNSCTLFADQNTKEFIDQYGYFKDRTYYTLAQINALYMNKAIVDITKSIMKIPTVLTECLSIAIYMGFKKVYLSGFDMDQVPTWIKKGRDHLRFYGYSKITGNDAEEEAMDQMEQSARLWYWVWETWYQLILLKKCADQHNVQIANVTDGGLLNIFPREDYEAVVNSL